MDLREWKVIMDIKGAGKNTSTYSTLKLAIELLVRPLSIRTTPEGLAVSFAAVYLPSGEITPANFLIIIPYVAVCLAQQSQLPIVGFILVNLPCIKAICNVMFCMI